MLRCLGKDIAYSQFLETFQEIKELTNITKYRSFQYKLLQRAVITNLHLKKWNVLDSSMCTFCGKEEETYLHLFVWCEEVKQLWLNVESFMDELSQEPIVFQEDTVLWSHLVAQPVGHLKNFISLVTKHYIYKQRCLKEKLNFEQLKHLIFSLEGIKKYYAIKGNKLNKHQIKWNIKGCIEKESITS